MRLFKRQAEAWKYLTDDITTEIVYWGWAWWGKSKLGSFWLATEIASKPWSTWCIWRSELKKIKLSTLVTFRQVLTELWFTDKSYKYDDQKGVMTFKNGSKVVLMDLNYNPSDPEFDRLWSMEFTWVFIDEAQEIDDKARQIINSRIRNLLWPEQYRAKTREECEKWLSEWTKTRPRHWVIHHNEQLSEYSVVLWKQEKPKNFMSCNPWRNFIYTDFYKPWRNGSLEKYRQFIQSLPTDNPFLPPSYIDNLKNLDKISRERLLYGNFDYSDDPWLLFNIDEVSDMFRKKTWEWSYYLTIDAARQGKDATEIWLRKWLHLIKIDRIAKDNLVSQKEFIEKIIDKYSISIDNVIVDEVWVWGWLVDMLWCKGFIANASPLQPYSAKLLSYKKRNYQNLKTQAFFYLQKYVQDWSITIDAEWQLKEDIIEELLFIRQVDIDNDSKIKLEGKKELKERLGRSPDLADMISFRMWWIIKNHHDWTLDEVDLKETNKEENNASFIQSLIDEVEWTKVKTDFEPDFDIY